MNITTSGSAMKSIIFMFALLISAVAHATTFGLHLRSVHVPAKAENETNNANYGLYVRTESGLVVGAYRNTHRRNSLYVGQSFNLYGPFDAVLGGITGYQAKDGAGYSRGAVSILAAMSYSPQFKVLNATPRITLVPGHLVKARTVIHLSTEWGF